MILILRHDHPLDQVLAERIVLSSASRLRRAEAACLDPAQTCRCIDP